MLLKTKSGEIKNGNVQVLLDYLGIKSEAAGVHKVGGEFELFAPVWCKTAETDTSDSGGIPWTFSTFDLDRFNERIDPLGWDFEQYCRNPVIQWAHCFHIPAIGRAEQIHADENGLHGVLVFNSKEYDEFGWSIGERVRAGVIRAGSVGFRVHEIEIPNKNDSKDGTSLIFRKQELLEFSVCNVPANPFALAENKEQRAESKEEGNISVGFWDGLFK